jgi:hypothetical protein
MKAHAVMTFNNGEQWACNLKGAGTGHIDDKIRHITNRLENAARTVCRWRVDYRDIIPGREYVRVNSRGHVSGAVYRVDLGASIIKRLR